MAFIWDGIKQGWHLLVTGNPAVWHPVYITFKVTVVATLAAIVIGLPVGLLLGLGRFRGRGAGLAVANVGLNLPPVLVGLILYLLMFPAAPLGRFHLLFTLHGVYLAQSILAIPIVAALTAASVRSLPRGLIDQARGFGAGRAQVWALALREARVGVVLAIIAAIGSSLSEVGAVALVGGNLLGVDQTLASATLYTADQAQYAEAVAIAIVLLGLILIVTACLTALQSRRSDRSPGRLGRLRLNRAS